MNKNPPLGRVVLIHGVRVSSRNRNLHKLAASFRSAGFCVVIARYGFVPAFLIGLFGWLDHRFADMVASFVEEDDILIGHSNGATLAYLISQKIRVKGVVMLNAALEPELAPAADFVHVYHNRGDWVVKLSGAIPFNIWGCMGNVGYTGNATHVVNIDQGKPPSGLPALSGHSDIFAPANIKPWGRYIAQLVVAAIRR